jgi:thiosulfate/3-mercaptopyruvate sulfurtransferase
MVALRSGVSTFDQCPQSTQKGFNGECANCHATCGDCHISIPNSAGRGFLSSHRFRKTPDQANNCTACHGSRIAHDFLGDPEQGRKGDVHNEKYMKCLDCHSQAEMHNAVADPNNTHRYNYAELPTCTSGCHADSIALAVRNIYHVMHYNTVTCYVCHSQPYNNCAGCHVDGEWEIDPVYQNNNPAEDFKIGINPLTSHNSAKYATLRHIPIAPGSYSNWGGGSATLPGYDDYPTWKFTSPHNIQRFTALTDTSGGKFCSESCHINANPENRKYFLFNDYIQTNWPEEVNANSGVVVDGHLPPGWE